jgi:pyrophosphatase PpaX
MSDRRFSTFLFDLDGTLIDSIELILTSYRHTLREHRREVPPDEVWLAGVGTPLRAQFRRFSDDAEEIEAMVATYQAHNLAHHDALVRDYPGVRDMVRALSGRGTRLGVVTSKRRPGTLLGLKKGSFDGLFDVLVTADDVERHKPHPEPVERALEQLGAEASEAVFVGDSPHDMAAGNGAGVATAAVLWGPFLRSTLEQHDPDFWIGDPRELTELAA